MRMRVPLLAVFGVWLTMGVALGDEGAAARRAAADRIVLQSSATPATGPLPPPAPLPAVQHPSGTWMNAAGQLAERAEAAVTPPEDVIRWRDRTRRALEQAALVGARLHAGGSERSLGGSPARILEVDASFPGSRRSARFLRIEGGESGAAEAWFARSFETFEAGGYYVRTVTGPGQRAVLTNTIDGQTPTLLWQVERVLIALSGFDSKAAERLDEAARKEGLYAAHLPTTHSQKGKGEAGLDLDSDADLPYDESFGKSKGLEDAPFTGRAGRPKPQGEAGATYDIPSLRANVTSVRFFESGEQTVDPGKRIYKQQFVDTESRVICWELGIDHPAPAQRQSFSIDVTWRGEDGRALATQTLSTHLDPEWTSSLHSAGNRVLPGAWPSGTYRVELSVGGKSVGSGSFRLLATAHLRDIGLRHNQVGAGGRKGFLILYTLALEGRRDMETHVGVQVQFANGTPLRDLDGVFRDTDGHVATHQVLRARYDSTLWTQSQIFFPIEQLHLATGDHTVRLQLWVYDPKTGDVLAESNWIYIDAHQH